MTLSAAGHHEIAQNLIKDEEDDDDVEWVDEDEIEWVVPRTPEELAELMKDFAGAPVFT